MIKSLLYVNLGLPIQMGLLIWIYAVEPELWQSMSLVYFGYNIKYRNIVEYILTILLIVGITLTLYKLKKNRNKVIVLFALELAAILIEFLIYLQHVHSLLSDYVPLSNFVAMIGVIPICVANIYIVFAARK